MKIEISFQLNLDVDFLRAKYEADLKHCDSISDISKVLIQQLDLIVAGDYDGAYDLIASWGPHERSYMDPVTNEIMNTIRHNREKFGLKRTIRSVE